MGREKDLLSGEKIQPQPGSEKTEEGAALEFHLLPEVLLEFELI